MQRQSKKWSRKCKKVNHRRSGKGEAGCTFLCILMQQRLSLSLSQVSGSNIHEQIEWQTRAQIRREIAVHQQHMHAFQPSCDALFCSLRNSPRFQAFQNSSLQECRACL
jgi:hypothetical protein